VSLPVVLHYRQRLDELRGQGHEPHVLGPMSELVSLLDLATTPGSADATGTETLESALLVVMGETEASHAALYVAEGEGALRLRASRGMASSMPATLAPRLAPTAPFVPGPEDTGLTGFALVCPVRRPGRPAALLALGPPPDRPEFGGEARAFVERLAACAAVPLGNGLMVEELRRVNRSLSVKIYQMHNLFDIGRELSSGLDEEAIERLVATTAMGHFLATRSAVYRLGGDGLGLAQSRGCRAGEAAPLVPADARTLLRDLPGPRGVADLDPGPLKEALTRGRFALAVPLAAGDRVSGLLAVGERPGGRPFGEEDADFVGALARQAQAALEGARSHRVGLEKERQDSERELAREIQQGLLPPHAPRVPGFDVAARTRSCFQVGGDYYDFIRLDRGRVGLVVADVSGKGTPASLMMASVHAWLQATAGTAPPVEVLQRLNRFLFAKTQTSRYVTLFYAELDPGRRRLAYVNAGHVPPHVRRAAGGRERLTAGGPVLGLLEEVELQEGEIDLGRGDLLAIVTDGVTEAESPAGGEFGDERVADAIEASARRGAEGVLEALVSEVDAWAGTAGCTDDLTALILRAT
jgi:phosphoserine phosphatase RsbU/P